MTFTDSGTQACHWGGSPDAGHLGIKPATAGKGGGPILELEEQFRAWLALALARIRIDLDQAGRLAPRAGSPGLSRHAGAPRRASTNQRQVAPGAWRSRPALALLLREVLPFGCKSSHHRAHPGKARRFRAYRSTTQSGARSGRHSDPFPTDRNPFQ